MRHLVIILFLIFSSCYENKQKEKVEKIVNLPESAFWIGTKKKGNWYNIESIHPHRNNAVISIYSGEKKELIVKKRFFKICPSTNLKFIEDLKSEIDFYDGKRIQLKDNCYLQ